MCKIFTKVLKLLVCFAMICNNAFALLQLQAYKVFSFYLKMKDLVSNKL